MLERTLVHVCTTMHDKRYKEGSSSRDLTNTCIIVFCMCMLARVLKNASTPQAACLSAARSLHPFRWSVPFVSLQASCCPESWEAGKADGAPELKVSQQRSIFSSSPTVNKETLHGRSPLSLKLATAPLYAVCFGTKCHSGTALARESLLQIGEHKKLK